MRARSLVPSGGRAVAVAIALLVFAGLPAVEMNAWGRQSRSAKLEARRHYELGRVAYKDGKFKEALEEYGRAYELLPLPALLFNIAQCHRNLGDYEQAVFTFRLYLEKMPNARNREAVEAVISQLEAAAEKNEQPSSGPQSKPVTSRPVTIDPSPPVTPVPALRVTRPRPTPFYRKWWFWASVGAVAAAAGGTALGIYFGTRSPSVPGSDLGLWNLSR